MVLDKSSQHFQNFSQTFLLYSIEVFIIRIYIFCNLDVVEIWGTRVCEASKGNFDITLRFEG